MALWTTDDMVTRVKRKASLADSNDSRFSTEEILAVADEELQSFVAPLLRSAQQDYWLKEYTTSITPNVNTLSIPELAVGGAIYDVTLIDTNGNTYVLARVNPNDVARSYWYTNTYTGWPRFYEVVSDTIKWYPIMPQTGFQVRVRYYRRSSKLVTVSACSAITGISFGSNILVVSDGMDGLSDGANLEIDVVQASSDFDVYNVSADVSVSDDPAPDWELTFNDQSLNTSVTTSDYVCLTGQTCIVPVPDLFHFVMVDRVAAELLDEYGDGAGADRIRSALDPKIEQSMKTIEPRVPTAAAVIYNRFSPMRCW
jgi:hypothetical protein